MVSPEQEPGNELTTAGMKTNKKIIFTLLLIFAVIVLVFFGLSYAVNLNSKNKKIKVENSVLTYAEEKYGKKFRIIDFKENRYWYGSDVFTLSPEDNNALRFGVYEDGEGGFVDSYAREKWGQELTNKYKPLVLSNFGTDAIYSVKVRIKNDSDESLVNTNFENYTNKGDARIVYNIAAPEKMLSNKDKINNSVKSLIQETSKTNNVVVSVGFVNDPNLFIDFVSLREIRNIAWDNSPIGNVKSFLDVMLDKGQPMPNSVISELKNIN